MPKHVPIDFCTKHRNAEEKKERRNNNRYKLLQCDDDYENHGEEKESETAINESLEFDKRKNKKENKRKKQIMSWKAIALIVKRN